ncbi:hypothetical protein OAA09_01505 [bacterium]|nr:hypothetical protein [bacterium]
MMMNNLVTPNFGRNPCLAQGDFVRITCDGEEMSGLVLAIQSRYTRGDIAGQAKMFTVAIPISGIDDEEGEWHILDDVLFDDVLYRHHTPVEPEVSEREGKVLQFDTVLCNALPTMV